MVNGDPLLEVSTCIYYFKSIRIVYRINQQDTFVILILLLAMILLDV